MRRSSGIVAAIMPGEAGDAAHGDHVVHQPPDSPAAAPRFPARPLFAGRSARAGQPEPAERAPAAGQPSHDAGGQRAADDDQADHDHHAGQLLTPAGSLMPSASHPAMVAGEPAAGYAASSTIQASSTRTRRSTGRHVEIRYREVLWLPGSEPDRPAMCASPGGCRNAAAAP
jgi:hypothetical protein